MSPKEMHEMAEGFTHGNIREIVELAKAYLALEASYEELKYKYIKATSENVMKTHHDPFKKLADTEEG